MKLLPFKAIFPNTREYSFVFNQKKLYVKDEAEASSFSKKAVNYNKYLLEQYKKGCFFQPFDEHMYLVKKETLNYSYVGIIAKINTNDLHSNKLKLHEETIKEKVFEYQNDLNKFNILTTPLILSHENNIEINSYYAQIMQAHYDVKISDSNNNYYFWKLPNDKLINLYFSSLNQFFIIDGHHRISSLKTLCSKNNNAYGFFISKDLVQSKNITRFYTNEYICQNVIKELSNKYNLSSTNNHSEKNSYVMLSHQYKLLKLSSQEINVIKKFLKDVYIKLSNGKINFNNTPEGKTQDSHNEKLILYIPGIIGKKLMDIQTIFPPHSTYFEPKFNNGVISVIVKD